MSRNCETRAHSKVRNKVTWVPSTRIDRKAAGDWRRVSFRLGLLWIDMAKTYADVQKEIKALQVKAQAIRQKEMAGVIARIKDAIAAYGITGADLGLQGPGKGSASSSAAASRGSRAGYADGQGNTWSGRGPRPQWLKQALASGKSLQDYAVDSGGTSSSAAAKSAKAKGTRRKVAAKYQDGSGNTWSGRGSQPRWLKEALAKGEKLETFAI